MIYIEIDKDNIVTFQHHMPFDDIYGLGKTESELNKTGYMVEEIPNPELNNKMSKLLFNKETSSFYYEYTNRSLTVEEEITQLKQKNQELETALVEMSTIAATQELRNIENEQAIMELTMLVGGNV